KNTVIDTLELARFLFPGLGNHRLNTLCKHVNVELTQHHRAIYDAEATAYLFWKMVEALEEINMLNVNQLNDRMGEGDRYKYGRIYHAILIVQNDVGLNNLYKLVSYAHKKDLYREPRVHRSVIEKHREEILVGSACDQGEIFNGMMQKSVQE